MPEMYEGHNCINSPLLTPYQVLGTPLSPAQGMEEHLRKVLLTRFPVLTIETIPLRGSINFKCEFGKYKEHKVGNFFFRLSDNYYMKLRRWWEGGGVFRWGIKVLSGDRFNPSQISFPKINLFQASENMLILANEKVNKLY